mmetsp:Transcript_13606/g.15115  ORF Transcript_13606/g.15115 Transcript_13606/m.15115 type:complete len:219 (+) Transcript_13606:407-1063(+)
MLRVNHFPLHHRVSVALYHYPVVIAHNEVALNLVFQKDLLYCNALLVEAVAYPLDLLLQHPCLEKHYYFLPLFSLFLVMYQVLLDRGVEVVICENLVEVAEHVAHSWNGDMRVVVAYDHNPVDTCSDHEKQDGFQMILQAEGRWDDDGLLEEEEVGSIQVLQELDSDDVAHASDEGMDEDAQMLPDDMDHHPKKVEVAVDVLDHPLNASFVPVAMLPK